MKPSLRFLRHGGIYLVRWGGQNQNQRPNHLNLGVGCRLPLVGPRAPVKDATEGARLTHRPQMSSGRLFLDRVARQHCPSPLHRQAHPKTVPGSGTMKLQRTANSVLSVCLSRGGNPRLKLAGTLSVLDEADKAGLVSFDDAVAELQKTSFRVSQAVLSEIRQKRSS